MPPVPPKSKVSAGFVPIEGNASTLGGPMPMRLAGVFRRLVSGLVVVGLLLLPVAPTRALPAVHSHAGMMSHQVVLPVSEHHHTGSPCTRHDTMDGACCLGTACTLAPVVPATHTIMPFASTPVRYSTKSDVGIGLTPEPDLGPPISHG